MSKFIVYHTYYGCDTGCCGHMVESDDEKQHSFSFVHPYGEDPYEFARNLLADQFGPEHINDLDWDNCLVLDD